MRNKKLILIGAGIIFLGLLAWTFSPAFWTSNKSKRIDSKSLHKRKFNEIPFTKEGDLWFLNSAGDTLKHIDVEVSRKPYEVQRGLMDRSTMEEGQGMIFIFKKPAPRSFWMKNTRIALDIMYVDENFNIVSIQENAQPFSEASLPSEGDAQYVIEVNAGFSQTYGIGKDTRVIFEEY